MQTIHIDASRSYDIIVGSGLLSEAGKYMKENVGQASVCIVSDDNVFPLYGAALRESLEKEGYRVCEFVFPHGERSKCMDTFEELLEFLYANHFTRKDVIAALGGGVVGDLSGYAAASYQRGIRFVQIPTTLLAAVDSSVGGKTAVNLKTGKNMVGAFYQPSMVLCDIDTLKTLPEDEYKCGCAEVIKYGVICDKAFFRSLRETPIKDQLERVISICVGMKRDVVQKDEFDNGDRMFLNFGHTFGHAAEVCSQFGILHGQGVSMGMALITRAAAKLGFCSEETCKEMVDILVQYELPTEIIYSRENMLKAALSDKKLLGSTMRIVVPKEIGVCTIETIPAADLEKWLVNGGVE